jgi:polysaccharide pyruvyl transferase WcaK-like protein
MIKDINFKNKIIIEHYNSNTQQVWNSISLCDFILTTRLHAGIFACFGNTPFMMVEYHEKCSDFLSDVGQSHNYRLYDAEFDINNIVSEIEKIINYDDFILPVSMFEMKEKAYKNFNLINL